MRRYLRKLKAFAEHPMTQLVTGLILLITGAAQIVSEFRDAEESFALGAHHGIAFYGLITALGSLPNVVDGIARSFTSIDKPEETEPGSGQPH